MTPSVDQTATSESVNHCGTCTLCCKTMKVVELQKPAHTWCSHCNQQQGCEIYAERPLSCRQYECLWLRSQAFPQPFSSNLRPDRCRVVMGTLNQGNEVVLYVSKEEQNAWQAPAFSEAMGLFFARGIAVHVNCNEQLTRVL